MIAAGELLKVKTAHTHTHTHPRPAIVIIDGVEESFIDVTTLDFDVVKFFYFGLFGTGPGCA